MYVGTRGIWRFRFGPWPVAVHWTFWFMTVLMALNYRELWMMVAWVAVVFVAILTHEVGHQIASRRYGADGHILLYSFGGLAFSQSVPPGRRWLVSLGGPAMNILTGLPFWYWENNYAALVRPSFEIQAVIHMWVFATLWWGLVNLLPILPLDGGGIFQDLTSMWRKRDTRLLTHKVSAVTAVLAGFTFLYLENRSSARGFTFGYGFFLMAIFAAMNIAAIRGRNMLDERPYEAVSEGSFVPSGREAGVDRFAGREPAGGANVVDLAEARQKKAKVTPGDDILVAITALERHDGARALDAIAKARGQKLRGDQSGTLDELEGWAYLAERKPVLAADVVSKLHRKSTALPFLTAGIALVGGERQEGIDGLASSILDGVEGPSKTLAIELVASEGVTAEVAKALLDHGGKGFESALKFQVALKKLGRSAHAAMVDDVILSGGA